MQPRAHALQICAYPARCGAWAGVAFPMQIPAHLCLSSTGLCFSGALRVQALPQLCFSRHILSFAGPSFSGAERRAAIPGHFITLRCPALPTRGRTSQIVAVPALINALQFRRLSARTIACAVQSLVKNCPTQPSALRGRPFAQGAGWLIMVRMRWRSASGFSVPCSTTTSS